MNKVLATVLTALIFNIAHLSYVTNHVRKAQLFDTVRPVWRMHYRREQNTNASTLRITDPHLNRVARRGANPQSYLATNVLPMLVSYLGGEADENHAKRVDWSEALSAYSKGLPTASAFVMLVAERALALWRDLKSREEVSATIPSISSTQTSSPVTKAQTQSRNHKSIFLSGGGFQVLKPSGHWCRKNVTFIVKSRHRQDFSTTSVALQKMLGGIRAVLQIECPITAHIHLIGKTDGRKVFRGYADASDHWVLRSSTTSRAHIRLWIEGLMALILLSISAVIFFVVLRKHGPRAQPTNVFANPPASPAGRPPHHVVNRPSEEPVAPRSDGQGQVVTKHCPSCGHEVRSGVRFCPKCGASISANIQVQESKRVCSRCHAENPPQVKFCTKCGNRL